jgi:hypothetical protein
VARLLQAALGVWDFPKANSDQHINQAQLCDIFAPAISVLRTPIG